jgi:hypothetical protein
MTLRVVRKWRRPAMCVLIANSKPVAVGLRLRLADTAARGAAHKNQFPVTPINIQPERLPT